MSASDKNTLTHKTDLNAVSQAALDTVLGGAGEMVLRFDAKGILIYANQIAEKYTARKRKDLLGKSIYQLHAFARFTNCWQEGFEKAAQGDAAHTFLCNYVNLEGNPLHLEAAVSADFDKDKNPIGVTMVCRDITEQSQKRQQAERMAERREFMIGLSRKFVSAKAEELDTLIDKALAEIGDFLEGDRTYIFTYDFKNGIFSNTFEWCNTGIESHKDELQNLPIGLYADWSERHLAGESIVHNDTSALDPKDPARQQMISQGIKSIIAVPFTQSDECIGFVGVDYVNDYHDCTPEEQELLRHFGELIVNLEEKRKYEEEKRLVEMRFKSIVERAFAGIYILRNGKFEFANHLFYVLIGYSQNELKAEGFVLEDLVIYKDEHAKQCIRERRSGDLSPKSYKVDIITKDGRDKTLTVNTTGIRDESGVYTLGIAFDVSEVNKRQEAIEEINKVLRQRNKELKEFAHITSHNLRAPVANIRGLLEHVDRSALENSGINIQIFDAITECTSGMHTTLEDMLHILRTDQDSHSYEKEVKFEDILSKIKSMLSDQLITVEASIESAFAVPHIKYHSGHLESFFLNMFTNAIRYRAEDRKPHIKVATRAQSDGKVQLSFRDNGQGIDLKTYGHKMFKMYQSFHQHPESRGVGLYLVKTQLDKNGGHIDVHSEPGEWTEFVMYLTPFS